MYYFEIVWKVRTTLTDRVATVVVKDVVMWVRFSSKTNFFFCVTKITYYYFWDGVRLLHHFDRSRTFKTFKAKVLSRFTGLMRLSVKCMLLDQLCQCLDHSNDLKWLWYQIAVLWTSNNRCIQNGISAQAKLSCSVPIRSVLSHSFTDAVRTIRTVCAGMLSDCHTYDDLGSCENRTKCQRCHVLI